MEVKNTNLNIQQIILQTTQQFKKIFDANNHKSATQNTQAKVFQFKEFNE